MESSLKLLWHKDGAEGGTGPLGSLAPIKLPKSLSTSFIILMLSPIDTFVANNMRMINADLKFMIIYVCMSSSVTQNGTSTSSSSFFLFFFFGFCQPRILKMRLVVIWFYGAELWWGGLLYKVHKRRRRRKSMQANLAASREILCRMYWTKWWLFEPWHDPKFSTPRNFLCPVHYGKFDT